MKSSFRTLPTGEIPIWLAAQIFAAINPNGEVCVIDDNGSIKIKINDNILLEDLCYPEGWYIIGDHFTNCLSPKHQACPVVYGGTQN